jgi:hypothetical protein
VPTVVIAVAAAWLGWQGWLELSEFGVARSIDAGRFQLAGPAVLAIITLAITGALLLRRRGSATR